MRWFSFVNFDIGSLMPLSCMGNFNHFTNLYFMTSASLFIIFALSILSRVAASRYKGKDNDDKNAKDWGALLFNNLLVFTFLILPTVSTKILHTAGCEELIDNDGIINHPSEGYFLKIDRSIRCDSSSEPERLGTNPEHQFAYWYAFFMGIIFVLGIPLGYLYLLWGQRFNLDPGQDALVGQPTAKFFNKETRKWEFMPHNGNDLVDGRLLFWHVKRSPKKRWIRFKGGQIETFKKKKLEEEDQDWTHVESMDVEEAKLCALHIRSLREEEFPEVKQLAFLYDSYEPRCWAFEVFETFRRLILTGGMVFLRPGTASQIVISMLICLFSMRVYAFYHPFINSKHDRLAEAAQWQLFFTLFGALAIKVQLDGENLQDRGLFGSVLAYMQFLIVMLIIFQKLQRKRLKEDGSEEEEVPVRETLKTIPCLGIIITKLEECISCVQSTLTCSKVTPLIKQAISDEFEDHYVRASLMNQKLMEFQNVTKAFQYASEVTANLRSSVLEFLNEKLEDVRTVFTDARDEKWLILEDEEGVDDTLILAEESSKAGFEAVIKMVQDEMSLPNPEDMLETSKDLGIDAVKEELKQGVQKWIMDNLEIFIENTIVPEALEKLNLPDKLATVVEREAIKRLHQILEYTVEGLVGALVKNIADLITNPTVTAKKFQALKLSKLGEGAENLMASAKAGLKEEAGMLVEEKVEAFKEAIAEKLGEDVGEEELECFLGDWGGGEALASAESPIDGGHTKDAIENLLDENNNKVPNLTITADKESEKLSVNNITSGDREEDVVTSEMKKKKKKTRRKKQEKELPSSKEDDREDSVKTLLEDL